MKRIATVVVAALTLVPALVRAQVVPPAPGVQLPQAYYDQTSKDKSAFQFQRAWIQKAQRAKAAREAYLSSPDIAPFANGALPPSIAQSAVVSGTVQVPVIMVKYANTGADPYPISTLQTKLFAASPALSVTTLYDEMSYGNITLTGTVYGWVQLAQNDTYYEGGQNGLSCTTSHTGALIRDALVAVDPTTDFGQYDNDGPDGIPNSGDDDGFVDFIAFVQPETGGECGTSNMWSHRWVVGGWPEFGAVCGVSYGTPWVTNDNSANGGKIMVWDYTIQPAKGSVNGCGTGTIEVGVFCHEFGHAFGLPDLYDTDGGGQGIGHWGLMGAGNWNVPTNPAHMSIWSKMELGWVVPTVVEGTAAPYTIHSSEMNSEAYQLNIVEEKFNRKNFNPIAGSYSLHCGINNAAASKRHWPGSGGYGNGWNESIRHDFTYDGSNPVTLQYDVSYDTEATYDFGYIKIDVNGTVSTVRTYTGTGSASNVVVDLTPYLNGSGASTYQIIAQFTSDGSFSDEDGNYNSGAGGPFKLDNVSVTGGGESYSSDFEQYEDGWYDDFAANPSREYFLVENRNKTGAMFDQNLWAQGLCIWHVEQNVAHSSLGNTSGSSTTSNLEPAGVTLMCADGLNQLLTTSSRGDAGDPYPGSTNNTTFDNTTTPNSKSFNDYQTMVSVTSIGAPAASMSATLQGGFFPPTITSILPISGEMNKVVTITDIQGGMMQHGATFLLRDASSTEYPAASVDWIGKAKITGTIDLTGVPKGMYDVVVRNPDGQEAVLGGAFEVTDPVPVFIQGFQPQVVDAGIELQWTIWADEAIRGFKLLRSAAGGPEVPVLANGLLAPEARSYLDTTVEPATAYDYALIVVLGDNSELRSPVVHATAKRLTLALYQNQPNPFNPSTQIQFVLPEASRVRLAVYDVQGRLVTTLVDGDRPSGLNEVRWNGRSARDEPVATGVYFYRLEAGKRVLTRKLLLLK
jgi:M6 family metalloprotease-like protein